MLLLIRAFYACTDEFHQLFVPGRAGLLSDVLIDSLSAVLGLVVFALLQKFVVWFYRRNSSTAFCTINSILSALGSP